MSGHCEATASTTTVTSRRDAAGKLNMQFSESLTPELPDGISFQPKSIEIWHRADVVTRFFVPK
jgi:hypothetical protein